MSWFDPLNEKDAERAAGYRLRHDQGRCAQDARLCSHCYAEEQQQRGDAEFEAALDAHFGVTASEARRILESRGA